MLDNLRSLPWNGIRWVAAAVCAILAAAHSVAYFAYSVDDEQYQRVAGRIESLRGSIEREREARARFRAEAERKARERGEMIVWPTRPIPTEYTPKTTLIDGVPHRVYDVNTRVVGGQTRRDLVLQKSERFVGGTPEQIVDHEFAVRIESMEKDRDELQGSRRNLERFRLESNFPMLALSGCGLAGLLIGPPIFRAARATVTRACVVLTGPKRVRIQR